jgi:3',5'-cyclic AMP phosphodiesterase CpdA
VHRVIIVSDSHLSAAAPEANANWSAVVEHVVGAMPQLVVHVGDVSLDGARDEEDLATARRMLDRLPVPWVAVPGNHDVGDNSGGIEPPFSEHRLARWRRALGPDNWLVEVGSWVLVGLNAQSLGSRTAAEEEQWEWLRTQLSRQSLERPIGLVVHKPLAAGGEPDPNPSGHRLVPHPARHLLLNLLDDHRVPLVLSGHVHQFRLIDEVLRRHVWAPTTWAVLPEQLQATVGRKRCGVVHLGLADDGTSTVELVEPEGLAQLTLDQDIPSPYAS